VNEALSEVRAYSDEAALERVWNRLETRRRRSLGLGPVSRGVGAAALVAAGVLLGMFVERQRAGQDEYASVASEVFQTPGVSAGPASERENFAAPDHRLAKRREAEKHRSRSRVKRLSAPVKRLNKVETEEEEVIEEAPLPESVEVTLPEKAVWLVLAERGEFAASFQKVDESGGFDAVLAGGSSEELMTLVEVARFVGRQGRAIQALRSVTVRHQGDPNAPIAAMILGNLLSRAGDAAGAAEAYALNRHLSPGGDFAEDALVREFDMAMADGDLASVERFRAQYEEEFPEGRHLEEIRADAAKLSELVPVSGGPAGSEPGSDADEDSSAGDESDSDEGPEASEGSGSEAPAAD
jgi:hypothetical protein